ncbi:GNAT family N-acetyltransferase [Anaeromyxobacter sp. SG66]|uniref:GNAT family N-acetyltransferase n=1 Tax=Anaeromyxobacter sp. SG66 TaxID=2925410 RepID=UPI001F58B3DF|nr:GNAT family N-acetyltransferase [Anaeromyxobacter sp. SG66]
MPFPDLRELARRIERAEAEQLARTGEPGPSGALELGGGLAVSKGQGSPFSAALGVGLAGTVTAAEVDRIEAHLGSGGGAIRIEIAAPADASLRAELARRSYRIERFHQIWFRAPTPLPEAPTVEVRPIRREEERAWAETFAVAYFGRMPQYASMIEGLLTMPRAPGNVAFGAFERGTLAGVALASAHRGVATLSGAGVVPERRGGGLQLALVRARLAWAAALGCDLAASATEPGTASQRTLEKAGFRCAYPRAVLVRER